MCHYKYLKTTLPTSFTLFTSPLLMKRKGLYLILWTTTIQFSAYIYNEIYIYKVLIINIYYETIHRMWRCIPSEHSSSGFWNGNCRFIKKNGNIIRRRICLESDMTYESFAIRDINWKLLNLSFSRAYFPVWTISHILSDVTCLGLGFYSF